MPFFPLSTSANILFPDTKAISMPEKNAEKTMVVISPMIVSVMVFVVLVWRHVLWLRV